MRTALLFSWSVAAILSVLLPAPALAAAGAGQNTAKPASGRGAQQPASRSGIELLVTDAGGTALGGVLVEVRGPTDRSGETNPSGQLTVTGLQAGTYRLRFTGPEVAAFEREVTLTAGRSTAIDVTLNPAPPPREIVREAPAPPAGPKGSTLTVSIPDVLEQDFVGKSPYRETLLSCSGDLRTTMVQLNEPLPERVYDMADASYYVLGGEGIIVMDGAETSIRTNDFASVPAGTRHGISRRGNRPLVLLAVLGGAPCEIAR